VTTAPPLDLETVYREHAERISRWAVRFCGPGMDARDIVQDVFVSVATALPKFQGKSEIGTWLFRITHNAVMRRRQRDRWRLWRRVETEDMEAEVVAEQRDAQELIEQQEQSRRVYEILDGMKERYRTVLILFEMEGLTGVQIGEFLGQKPSTVFVQLHRARADFLRRLEARARKESV